MHGYSLESTPLWAGIYLLPITAGFLVAAPIAGFAELLEPYNALQQPGVNAEVLTGQTFFPHLIIEPFHSGLVVEFVAVAIMMVIGLIASLFTPADTVRTSRTLRTARRGPRSRPASW